MIGARTILLALAVLAVGPATAQTFSQRFYRDARLKSEFHVQFEIDSVRVPSETPGLCVVTGKIRKVFRGPVKPGEPVNLDYACKKAADKPKPGATLWTDVEDLVPAKFVEAYLNRGPYGYAIALWQTKLVPELTDKAQLPP
ncbi:MAG: hypothetical protein AB7O45_10120 [Alphaproteobacteria bacterium]